MLTSFLLALSIATVILVLLDLLLAENQKKCLGDFTMRAWNLLDDWCKISVSNWSSGRVARSVTGGALLIGVFVGIYSREKQYSAPGLTITCAIIVFAWLVAARQIFQVLAPLNAGALVVTTLLAFNYFYLSTVLLYNGAARFDAPLFSLVTLFAASFILLGLVSAAVLISCVHLAIAYTLRGILTAVGFVIRRLLEYPKGPILGLGAGVLIGALAALMKLVL